MLGLAPLILGWIYLCLTVIGLGGRHLLPFLPLMGQEMAFTQLTRSLLGPLPTVLLFLAVLAAAVSTAGRPSPSASSFPFTVQGDGGERDFLVSSPSASSATVSSSF